MKKIVPVLGVLALFGACNDPVVDETATGGTGGASSKGGAGGTTTAGKGGDSNPAGSGNVEGGSANSGGSGTGGEVPQGGIGPVENGGTGGSLGSSAGAAGIIGAGGSTEPPPEPVPSTDTCADGEATPNDDHASATQFKLGTSYMACLQSAEDVDVYAFQVPADSTGGYVTVSITGVGPNGDISASAYTAEDNGRFYKTGTNVEGAEIFLYFTAKPGAKFYLPVSAYAENTKPNPYTLTIVYHQVHDAYEPNDLRNQAKHIALNAPIEAYMFAGREYSTPIPEGEWEDWYRVDLAAGPVDIVLSVNARDLNGKIVLFNSVGTQIETKGDSTEGSSVELQYEIATAGSYYVKVLPYSAPATEGNTSTVPYYFRLPYTLSVNQ